MDRAEAEELLRTLFADPEPRARAAEDELVPDADPAVASIGHQIVGIVLRDLGETDDGAGPPADGPAAGATSRSTRSGGADVLATLGATLVHRGADAGRPAQARPRPRPCSSGLPSVGSWCGAPGSRATCSPASRRAPTTCGAARVLFDGGGRRRVASACALNLEGLATSGSVTSTAARQAFAAYARDPLARGSTATPDLRQHNTGVDGLPPRATCRSRWSCTPRRARASTRSGSPASTSSTTGAAPTSPPAWPTDALDVVEQALVARPLLPARRRRTCCWRSPRRRSRRATGRARRSAADEAGRLFRRQSPSRAPAAGRTCSPSRPVPSREAARRRPCCGGRSASSTRLREAQVAELPQALLLGARLARARSARPGRPRCGEAWLDEAAGFRSSPSGRIRVLGWLALAQRRALDADRRRRAAGVRRRSRGARRAPGDPRQPGAARRSSSGHGAELAELGTRTALASGDARRLLRWSERWRATALTIPPTHDRARPGDDRRPGRPARPAPAARRGARRRGADRAARRHAPPGSSSPCDSGSSTRGASA